MGTGAQAQFFLNTIDDLTGQASRSLPITRDLRGLESGGGFNLIAIADNSGNDQLVRVNTLTGTITVIGSTGFSGVQALACTLACSTPGTRRPVCCGSITSRVLPPT